VFAATLADRLGHEGVPVLYFYFRRIIDANYSPVAALRDWLDQILQFSPPLQMKLNEYLDTRRTLASISTSDMWSHLRMALTHIPKSYCIVDALDEMDQGDDQGSFLRALAEIGQWKPSQVKLIVTSRPVVSVEKYLRTAKCLHIRLEEQMVDIDIATYVQHRLRVSLIPVEHHDAIIDAVPGTTRGLFIYAKLAMDSFLRPNADVQEVLQQLPRDLNSMFADLLREHARRSGVPNELQLLIMEWVTHASRPLRLLEIGDMINVTQYSPSKRDLKAAKDVVRSACGPLLEILPNETISVIHHSFTEFLNGSTGNPVTHDSPILDFGSTHNRLALICLSYLQSGCLDDVRVYGYPYCNVIYRQKLPPAFLQYAARNWVVHARKAELAGVDQTEVNTAIEAFLTEENIEKWLVLSGTTDKNHPRAIVTRLVVAVSNDLTSFTRMLLGRSETKTKRDDVHNLWKKSPICLAAKKGYGDIVDLLLQHGADPKEFDEEGLTALHQAARYNHPKVIGLLLRAGVDPMILARNGRHCDTWEEESRPEPALLFACESGHDESILPFLPFLDTSSAVNQVLGWAVETKRADLVKLILQHPLVMVDAEHGSTTPLVIACSNRDSKMVRLLLEAKADPNIHDSTSGIGTSRPPGKTKRGYTALHAWASASGCRYRSQACDIDPEEINTCFQLLLESGANLHQIDIEGNTALHHAFDAAALRILLAAGLDPNAVNDKGETLLHICRDENMVRILIEKFKADTTLKRHRDIVPSLTSIPTTNALRLLELGADATGIDINGNGAIHIAVGRQRYQREKQTLRGRLIESLVAAGADLNLRNNQGQTPLHLLSQSIQAFDEEMFNILVGAGAELDIKDHEGQTPLLLGMKSWSSGNEQARIGWCENMRKAGALIDTMDFKGQTLLHICTSSSYGNDLALFKYLVSCGLDPKHTDFEGNTLLLKAAVVYTHVYFNNSDPPEIFPELIRMGVDPDRPNNKGRTVLHILSSISPGELKGQGNIPDVQYPTVFDYFLALQKNIDHPDNNGTTALHLASTFSEYQTMRLLEAGADPSRATYENLTSLQLAARSRRPNIIGLLLDSLKTQWDKDAVAKYAQSALPFACTSGLIESVKLLVLAGAKLDHELFQNSPWQCCAAFEEEEANWPLLQSSYRIPTVNEIRNPPFIPDAGAVKLGDKTRKMDAQAVYQIQFPTTRLDEILELLVSSGCCEIGDIDRAIASAGKSRRDYTVQCMLRIRGFVETKEPYKFDFETYTSSCRRKADLKALKDFSSLPQDDSHSQTSYFQALMSLREYDHVIQMLEEDCLRTDTDPADLILIHLVFGGFASIIKKVLTPEAAAKLDDSNWCEQQEKASPLPRLLPYRCKTLQCLMTTACQRVLPNMDVLQILVEDVAVNLNARSSMVWDSQIVYGPSALHTLVREDHWWQVNQALPYLVKHGADIEARDSNGLTPLATALDTLKTRNYAKRAAEILIKLGADVNSVDNRGKSCLARAGKDIETMALLLRHGAIVDHPAIIAAINMNNLEILEALLSHGANPDMRQTINKEKPAQTTFRAVGWKGRQYREFDVDEMYPLHYVAVREKSDLETNKKMIKILLDHGANPNARYGDTNIMHQIIARSGFTHLFLGLPLNLESRDESGATLLLTACLYRNEVLDLGENADGDYSLINKLLDLGANVRARDNSGRNALHYLFESNVSVEAHVQATDTRALNRIITKAPEIINQHDSSGETPFHVALDRLIRRGTIDDIEALISAGANVRLANGNGDTPLHLLFEGDWFLDTEGLVIGYPHKLFDRFIELGLDINARNHTGETPIFSLFRSRFGEVHVQVPPSSKADTATQAIVEEELQSREDPLFESFHHAGVQWDVVNKAGETLLHVIARKDDCRNADRDMRRFKWLMGKGLDLAAEDVSQRTALDVAAASGKKKILALFERK
jgi:ankyrin repeat protein